jgi:hypothetical protein
MQMRLLLAILDVFAATLVMAHPPTPSDTATMAGKLKCGKFIICARDGTARPSTVRLYNVANAPAWQANLAYGTVGHLGNRVLVGPGLNPGASPTYNNGAALYLLELTRAGTSGSSQPTVSNCPSAGIGDGTAVWQCLTPIDYITLSSAFLDDPVQWAPGGHYYAFQIVINTGVAWQMCAGTSCAGTRPATTCASAAAGTGPGSNPSDINTWGVPDGNCEWRPRATIPYTAGSANAWPHQITGSSTNDNSIVQSLAARTFNIWHHGARGHPYVPRQNGEASPIPLGSHQESRSDSQLLCPGGATPWPNCGALGKITIQAAPGDAWSITTTGAFGASKGTAIDASGSEGISIRDTLVTISGLQCRNTNNDRPCFGGEEFHNNGIELVGNLIDSAGLCSFGIDSGGNVHDNLIINRNGSPGAGAACSKYETRYSGNTIVGLGTTGANSSGIIEGCIFFQPTIEADGAPPITKNIIVGFQQAIAAGGGVGTNSLCKTYTGGATTDNVTDLPNTSTNPSFVAPYLNNQEMGSALAPTSPDGNLFSQSPASLFVNPSSDFRLSPTSPARSVGAGVQ